MLTAERTMTEKSLAAHRSNARESRGAASAAGKERARAANLRHGFYSRRTQEALVALGERPEDLDDLIAAAHEQFSPVTTFEERMVEGLAIAWFRMERAGRLQESLAVRRLEWSEGRGQVAIRQVDAALTRMLHELEVLGEYVGREGFYTPRPLLQDFHDAFRGKLEGGTEEIFVLMHRLRRPERREGSAAALGASDAAAGEPAVDVFVAEAIANDDWETQEWLENQDAPLPRPEIPVAEGPEREELRQQLEQLVAQEVRALEAAREEETQEHGDGLSCFERDEVIAATGDPEAFLQRQEQSCFRRVMRLGTFLTKIQEQRHRAQPEDDSGHAAAPPQHDPALNQPARLDPPPPELDRHTPRRRGAPARAPSPASGERPGRHMGLPLQPTVPRRRGGPGGALGQPQGLPLTTLPQTRPQPTTSPRQLGTSRQHNTGERPARERPSGQSTKPQSQRSGSSLATGHLSLHF